MLVRRSANEQRHEDWKDRLTDLKYMDLAPKQCERIWFEHGDVLFNRTNSAELVGKTAIFRESRPLAYAGYLVRLRLKNGTTLSTRGVP